MMKRPERQKAFKNIIDINTYEKIKNYGDRISAKRSE
jgi:hypothetical protein